MPALVASSASVSTPPSFEFDSENEIVELPILLPEWQVTALERAAQQRGMTIGQLLRRLFADLFPPAPRID
jgi:hypothetical protein